MRSRKRNLMWGLAANVLYLGLLNLSGSWLVHDIVTAGESFGWVLMMAMGILHLSREEQGNHIFFTTGERSGENGPA